MLIIIGSIIFGFCAFLFLAYKEHWIKIETIKVLTMGVSIIIPILTILLITIHNDKKPIYPEPIPPKPIPPGPNHKKKHNVYIDAAQDRADTKVYIDDELYENSLPCTLQVREGTHELKLVYDDPDISGPLTYMRFIVVNQDMKIPIESNEFR